MAGREASPAGLAGSQFPARQTANTSLPDNSSSGRLDVLSVKTPLLPRRSGINMESAKSYGADMEKRSLIDASEVARPEIAQSKRPSGSALRWVAGLSLLGVLGIAIFRSVPSSWTTNDWIEFEPIVAELYNRQASTSTSQCTDTSNCTQDLVPFTLKPLPLGSIKPLGWLRDQMQGMADGLAGHEHDFYPIVSDSYWIGGKTDYSSLNEGLPYWFNGLVPLAYGLGDERLITQVQSVLSTVLQRQDNVTGVLGPADPDTGLVQSDDTWGRYPFMLGMMQIAEADSSVAPEVVSSLYRWIPYLYKVLADGVNPTEVWGRARYQDAIITLQWLYENYPEMNGTDQRPLLSNTMYRLKQHGADWIGYYQQGSYIFEDLDFLSPPVEDDGSDGDFKFTHGVNVGEGLKTPSVDYRLTHNSSLLGVQQNAIDWTLTYHGSSAGTVVGDERESNLSPNRGSELCTAVELMYSMAYSYAVTGVNAYADHAERAAFNALPVMMSPDNWAHQYITQANMPWASDVIDGWTDGGVSWNVGNAGYTYGLAPNYPCCTVNHPQGYPKFASHMFMSVGDDGLAHVLLSPGNVTTKLGNGANVNVATQTAYPFSDILTYEINTDNPFTFYVRVPEWAANPVININGNTIATTLNDNSLAAIPVPAGQSTIQYLLESSLTVVPRSNDTVAVYHGALLYALDVGYLATSTPAVAQVAEHRAPANAAPQVLLAYQQSPNVDQTGNTPAQAKNYNVSNTMPWNFAIDPNSLKYFNSNSSAAGQGTGVNVTAVSGYADETTTSNSPPSLANPIWDYHAPEQYIKGIGCVIDWPLKGNTPDIVPAVADRNCTGKPVEVILRPYGSLKVHMAELPSKNIGAPSLNGTSSR